MKSKLIISIIIIAIIATLAFRFSQKKPVVDETLEAKPVTVSVQTAAQSSSFKKNMSYPAIVASQQEATLTATTSGTVTRLSFELGKNVTTGQRLVTLDTNGTISSFGENGLKNSQIQALELAASSALENYKLLRDAYRKDENYANKKAKEIAQINLLAAQSNLKGALDGQFISAPISGTITQKFVSLGDSVSAGQAIATIARPQETKISFYADSHDLAYLKIGDPVSFVQNNLSLPGKISLISPQADESTKRFLVEALPTDSKKFNIGSVINVNFDINYLAQSSENLILPLSAVTISQNENYIFINQNGLAKKINVEIVEVFGEMAEIKTSLTANDEIIIDGSKLIKDASPIKIETN